MKLFGKKRIKTQTGFTLIETMIALMIVAIALPAMVSLVSIQLESAGSMRDRTYAYWVAQNELTRYQLLQREKEKKQLPNFKLPEKESGYRELMGLRWQWYMSTQNIQGLPVQGFKRVTIEVNLIGPADGSTPLSSVIKKPESSLARLTGFISDPEDVTR